MKRIDRILEYIAEQTGNMAEEDLRHGGGITAAEIADHENMLRNNVSKELNELLRADHIIKIKGRPVKFLHKETVEYILQTKLKEKQIEVQSLDEILHPSEQVDPFHSLIGFKDSMRNQVEQGKAAILYPPRGLHTLIVGQTGVGKTLFAKLMYNYGKHMKRFSDDSPFIVFNCADYYNNPQLLLSHIFGYVKGAFTGADSEKKGLVEKADGGILFLDEIHRLPPEGQEMIFYFMDTHTYNKLGESERDRSANVLLVAATTEDPASSMLKTFIRRIPITINIPPFQERTPAEQFQILKHLLESEGLRVNKPIRVEPEVVKALIGSVTYGNIGQLKSNIQLVCAKGFLNSIRESREELVLDFKLLPGNIREGLFNLGKNRREIEEFGAIVSPLYITPEGSHLLEEDVLEPPFNLYKLIEDKISLLKDEGLDDSYINKFITTDVNIHIKSFYNRFYNLKGSRERILKIVDNEILEFSEEVKELVERELDRKYSERFVYAFSLHLSAFLKRIREKKYGGKLVYDPVDEHDEEYKVALTIKDMIEYRFGIDVPGAEITYVAILLKSVEEERQGNVGIIVATHGNSTASSIVGVVNSLLGSSNICAVDMPLNVSPKEILEIIVDKVKGIDCGRGVLMLVDMGSLLSFEAIIMERVGVKVKTIDMVSTPLTLEAVRKASILDMELEDIYRSLMDFRGYNNMEASLTAVLDNKVIITVCSSGKGAAVKVKEFVEKIVYDLTEKKITVIPAKIRELDKVVKEFQAKQSVLAVIGVKRPGDHSVPFIPLELLIDTRGQEMLRELLVHHELPVTQADQNVVIKSLCEDGLKEFLTYLNPHKILGTLMEFVEVLERELQTDFEYAVKVQIVIHTAQALERMVIQDGLVYRGETGILDSYVLNAVSRACSIFADGINLTLTDDEQYYICEILSDVYKMTPSKEQRV
ncbi:sigma-54-dependent transcriptional regulator [Paenibacillus sonchi]|uniref:sigma-54-dependent transcriptional regulator n=1 Tax=Paenibacillus sonchi TaxID=373687 RepID=UPI001E2AEBF6|nr:sigma-54-dependent transcriptional regulator [Paenibacillus sonchi]MCE3200113.1 sigma 54-interacting transcriptional regulator [Paenibacillus sonchi]